MRRFVLADTDVVLYADGAKEALHGCFLRAYELAKAQVIALGLERTDSEGEIHRRNWRLVFGEDQDSKTLRQLRFYFGPVLRQISEQAPGRWTPDAWHEAFKRTILGFEVVQVKVAGRKRPTTIRRLRAVKDLSVKQMSEYIDQVLATGATDLGVVFDLDPGEREAVRYRRKALARAKKQEVADAVA